MHNQLFWELVAPTLFKYHARFPPPKSTPLLPLSRKQPWANAKHWGRALFSCWRHLHLHGPRGTRSYAPSTQLPMGPHSPEAACLFLLEADKLWWALLYEKCSLWWGWWSWPSELRLYLVHGSQTSCFFTFLGQEEHKPFHEATLTWDHKEF